MWVAWWVWVKKLQKFSSWFVSKKINRRLDKNEWATKLGMQNCLAMHRHGWINQRSCTFFSVARRCICCAGRFEVNFTLAASDFHKSPQQNKFYCGFIRRVIGLSILRLISTVVVYAENDNPKRYFVWFLRANLFRRLKCYKTKINCFMKSMELTSNCRFFNRFVQHPKHFVVQSSCDQSVR